MAAPTFVAKSRATGPDNITVPAPAGVAAGDLLIATCGGSSSASGAAGVSSGWTLLESVITGTGIVDIAHSVLTKVATSAEPASYAFTGSGNGDLLDVTILAYRGVAAIDAWAQTSAASGTLMTAPSVTTTKADARIVALFCEGNGGTVTPQAPLTIRENADLSSRNAGVGDRVLTSVGASGTSTATQATSNDWVAFTVALQPVNSAPNAPTLVTMAAGGSVDQAKTNRAAHQHSDPDGDGQTAFTQRYRLVTTPTPSWTTLPRQVTANQFYDFPAGSLAVGDYERQVQTEDAVGPGPWSASGFFSVIVAPAGPTFLDPINGQTISTSDYVATISSPAINSWESRVLADLAGAPDELNVINPVTTRPAAARSFPMTSLPNGQTVHPQARTELGGLWSPWVSVATPVSFTPPATPTLTVTPDDATASIGLVFSQPTPSGGQPVVSYVDVYRREGDTGAGIRIAAGRAPSGLWNDYTPASGVAYTYRLTAVGENGTATAGPWTDDAAPQPDFAPADFAPADFA